MNIRILGAHNSETETSKYVSLLVDDILAIDTGGFTSSLSLEAQKKIKAILITHKHYDHLRDIPSLAINLFFQESHTTVHATEDIYDAIVNHLLNGVIYPNFFTLPETNPTLTYSSVEPGVSQKIEQYNVLPIKMNHNETTVGYQLTSSDNKSLFYTSDTGRGLSYCWELISPQLLITEVTVSNSHQDFALKTNHLTPELLRIEMESFLKIHGYLPRIIAIHMTPEMEEDIKVELAEVASNLAVSIDIAYEGMQIQL